MPAFVGCLVFNALTFQQIKKFLTKSFKMSQLFLAGKSQQGRSTGNKNRGATNGSERLYEDYEKD